LAGGAITGLLVGVGTFAERAASASGELGERNQRTLSSIACRDVGAAWTDAASGFARPLCDIGAIENNSAFDAADYVLDLSNRYFIYNKSRMPGSWLDNTSPSYSSFTN
jgi:hypothetical protein